MYTHVNKCKNDKIKEGKNIKNFFKVIKSKDFSHTHKKKSKVLFCSFRYHLFPYFQLLTVLNLARATMDITFQLVVLC
jgi:hypothetical protein